MTTYTDEMRPRLRCSQDDGLRMREGGKANVESDYSKGLKAWGNRKKGSCEIGFGTASALGCAIQLKGLTWPESNPTNPMKYVDKIISIMIL